MQISKPALRMEFNVGVVMRDGVRLSTDIYRPDDTGAHPVLLTRTCYVKSSLGYVDRARFWVEHGYIVLVQDVRGRGDSEGGFYPIVHEAEDGFDTLQWAAAQPWCNGKLAGFGGSYAGWTQLFPATLPGHGLSALVPMATPPDPVRNFPWNRGVLMIAAAAWLATLDGRSLQDLSAVDVGQAQAALPLLTLDHRLGRNLPVWRDWLDHPALDTYWQAQSYQTRLLDSEVPMLHVSGWYDDMLVGSTENFIALTAPTRPARLCARQRLIIGPWLHGTLGQRKIGDIDFGPEAELNLNELMRRWFDHWLRGHSNGVESEARVRVFAMGRNRWLNADAWPIPGTRFVPYYLRSQGAANSRLGDGCLASEAPSADEPPDRYTHDPADPAPYPGAENWKQVGGPDDHSDIELRRDVLVYTTPALEQPLLLCGPLRVRLFAASSAPDTDWTAKVLAVRPDGSTQRLNDGIARARFRFSASSEELLQSGVVQAYDIDCWSTCIELPAGWRIRLEIASSAAGKSDVNLNTGGPIGKESSGLAAEQTVFHDAGHLSCLFLPLLDTMTH